MTIPTTKFFSENMKEMAHMKDPGTEKRVILKWILNQCDGKVWNAFPWLRTGISCSLLQSGNELLGCIKCSQFREQLSNYELGKTGSGAEDLSVSESVSN
jgi:hypothetical protein